MALDVTCSAFAPPDKTRLVTESYATDEPLSVRIETHRRYSVPAIDLPAWVLDRYSWRGDETVLDIGTGASSQATWRRVCCATWQPVVSPAACIS